MQPSFFPRAPNGTATGSQQTGTAAASASVHVPPARAAMQPQPQPPPLFSRASLPRAPPAMTMSTRAPPAFVPSFIRAAPPPPMPSSALPSRSMQQTQPQPPPPPRQNGLSSRSRVADRADDDSDSDSDADKFAPSAQARQKLGRHVHRSRRESSSPPRSQARASHRSHDDFKPAQPIPARSQREAATMQRPDRGGSSSNSSSRSGSSRDRSAVTPPLAAASASASAAASSPPALPSARAPAPPPFPTFNFHRALPRIDLAHVSVPFGWTARTADVVIIGAGAAGLQCAEQLSNWSPLRFEGASSNSPSHSLSILVLEGRDRIGGRVFSEPWQQGSSKVIVEHGAAFIHGCDSGNLAFRTAVKYGMRRFIKNDFNDGWFCGGRRLDPDHAISLRQVFEVIDGVMLRKAQALLQDMTNNINTKKVERKQDAVKMEDDAKQERASPIDDEAQPDAIKQEPAASPALPASSASSSPGTVNDPAPSVSVASPRVKLEVVDPIIEQPAADSDSDDSLSPPSPAVKSEQESALKAEPNTLEAKQPERHLAAANSSSDSESDSDSDSAVDAKPADSPLRSSSNTPPASNSTATFSDMPALERASGGTALSSRPASSPLADLCHQPAAMLSKQANRRKGSPSLGVNHSSSSSSTSSSSSSISSPSLPSSDSSDREASKASLRRPASPRGRKRKAGSPSSSSDASAIDLTSPPASELSPSPRSPARPSAKRRHIPSSSENEPSDDEAKKPAAALIAGLSYSSSSAASSAGCSRPKVSLQIGASPPVSMDEDEDEGESHWSPKPLSNMQPPAGSLHSEGSSDESDPFAEKRRHNRNRRGRSRDSSRSTGSSRVDSLREMRRKKQQKLKRFQATISQTSPGSVNSAQAASATSSKPARIEVRLDPGMDRTYDVVFEEALEEYKQNHKLSAEDEQIVKSIATSQFGYVGELSKLSATDMLFTSGRTGGERSLLGGFQSVLSKLLHRCTRRSKRDQCYFQVLHDRTVSVIEQPNWKDRADDRLPLVLCYVPARQEVYVSHFVVSTASIGIMQASIQHNVELATKQASRLLKPAELQQTPYKLPTHAASAAAGEGSSSFALSSDWSDKQLEAALVFVPPLSDDKVEAFSRMGMGCENKVILQFAPGARFWPRALHVLRGTGDKQWRFYSLGGIRGDDCNVLIAHQPPPKSREMESRDDEEILAEVMAMLREMFSDEAQQRNAQDDDEDIDADAPRRYLPRSALVNNSQEWTLYDDPGDASDEMPSSDDDGDATLSRRREQHRGERDTFRHQDQIDDGEWRSKPVVAPIKLYVTRWAQDPYALGAYSFVPRGCELGRMVKRLQLPEPPLGPNGSPALAGGLYFAGEATSTLDSQQVHGAMASGARVAKCIVGRIKKQMQMQQS